jgi:exodeoxyribonuclease VII large subunit
MKGQIVDPSFYTVTQITRYIKERFETDLRLQDLWVEGEISNWKRSSAGHCYLTLKDAGAAIRAVIWRSIAERLPFAPRDGQAVLAHGHVSVYEPQGQYQLYVDMVQPVGLGALYLQFQALKERLASEGLFDEARKRPLPAFPATIGVVTSPTGAALRDVRNVLSRRWPLVRVLLAPTLVQGDDAPPQIVAALRALYRRDDVDLILVTRGGGSIEDLWAFNDERVARTIAESPVPVISGVGHEVDFTIADFVADRRAPTPSAAAEVAVPDQVDVRGQLVALRAALEQNVRQRVDDARRQLDLQRGTLARLFPRARLEQDRQRVDDLMRRVDQARQHRLILKREQLSGLKQRLRGLNPFATLERGYAIVRRQDGQVVRRVAQAPPGESIEVRVSDGAFAARVSE